MKTQRSILIVAVVALSLSVGLVGTFAQDNADICPTVVDQALDATNQLCVGTGRNKVCYGHVLVNALPQPGYDSLDFEQPGDIVDVATLQSLILASFNAKTGAWGIAQLRLQASLPTATSQDITILVFGDVELENAVAAPTEIAVTVTATSYLPVYTEPSVDSDLKQLLIPGRAIVVMERLEDGSWLRIEDPYTGLGWIQSEFVTSEVDLNGLNVVEPDAPFYRPMQAFYLNSGADANGCSGIPSSGLLIQTPEGVAEVTLLINEVNINMASTVYVNAQPGGKMVVGVLEGHAVVGAGGDEQMIMAGNQVTVPMSQDLSPSAPPGTPQPYNQDLLNDLPVESLDRPVAVEPPATPITTSNPISEALNTTPIVHTTAGGDTTAGGNPNTDGDPNAGDNGAVNGDSGANGNGGGNGNANGNGNGNANGNGNGNANGNGNGGGNGNANANGNGNANGNNGNGNGGGNGNANGNSNGNANGNGNGNANGNGNGNANGNN